MKSEAHCNCTGGSCRTRLRTLPPRCSRPLFRPPRDLRSVRGRISRLDVSIRVEVCAFPEKSDDTTVQYSTVQYCGRALLRPCQLGMLWSFYGGFKKIATRYPTLLENCEHKS
jgi:hypothetical protein